MKLQSTDEFAGQIFTIALGLIPLLIAVLIFVMVPAKFFDGEKYRQKKKYGLKMKILVYGLTSVVSTAFVCLAFVIILYALTDY